VTVLAGNGNTIQTQTGTALNLDTLTVGAQGITFQSVAAANAAGNGIIMNNLTGGLVSITGTGTTANSGGTVAAAGDAVSITNVARVSLNNMNLSATGNGAQAIDFNVTTAAQSRAAFNNNEINVVTAGAGENVLITIGPNATNAQLTITNNNIVNGADNEAVRLSTANNANAKTVTMLFEGNDVVTNSADAGEFAANFQSSGGTVLNATVRSNNFSNTGSDRLFNMVTNDAGSEVHLDLDLNTASQAAGDLILNKNDAASTYEVDRLATVDARNGGDVIVGAGIVEETDSIPLPTAP
jgi:hypothetical protein